MTFLGKASILDLLSMSRKMVGDRKETWLTYRQ
jgi:hypothetical protein